MIGSKQGLLSIFGCLLTTHIALGTDQETIDLWNGDRDLWNVIPSQ